MNRQTVWTLVIGALLTAAVVTGAVFMLRSVNTSPDQASPAPGEGTTEATDTTEAAADIVPRPDCPSPTVGGVDLECLGGTEGTAPEEGITVANVWAWWCAPCRDELPYFDDLAAAHPEYRVVAVHADRNSAYGASMLDELGVQLPSFQDRDNTFAGTLGLPGVIPLTVVFDGTEQIGLFPRAFRSGEELEAAVTDLVENR